MNYIKTLQEENKALKANIETARFELLNFRLYLQSSKFNHGDTLDGYVSCQDALNWTVNIHDSLTF